MYLLQCHHAPPLEVAEDGNDHVKRVERGLERDVLVEIERAGHHVDDNPDEPLLHVFAGQRPDAHETQGCGEGVGHGHRGPHLHQPVPQQGPDGQRGEHPRQDEAALEVGDGPVGTLR